MAEKVATEVAKQAIKPKLLVSVGTMFGVGFNVAASVAQDANNRIVVDLCQKRHGKKQLYIGRKTNENERLSQLRVELKQNNDALDDINSKITDEEKAMSTFENIENDENIKFFVGLGHTGNGKSTVMNRLYADQSLYGDKGPFEASDSDQSVTEEPNHKECLISNIKCVLVDTPGYKDSKNRDNLHFNNLESYLYGCGGVDVFLLIVNGTNKRFDGNFQLMLKEYETYFGTKFWKHLIIILTRIEGIEKDRFNDKDKILQQNIKKSFDSIDDECNIPIITIGFNDDYSVFCQNVMNEVINISQNNSKFICNSIKSPIKKLKQKKTNLENKITELNNKIIPKQQQMHTLDNKIQALQNKIDNPEKYPLFTNYYAKI